MTADTWQAIALCIGMALVGLIMTLLRLPQNLLAGLAQRRADLDAKVWTDADGEQYDLTIAYRDAWGDVWTCIGWLTPFDGVPIPYVECSNLATDIEDAIREFGPLTPRFREARL